MAKPVSKVKPKPNPTPTSLKQLKNVIGTQMIVPKDKETGKSLEGTERDRNTYRGTYGGKKWIWKNGIASLDK